MKTPLESILWVFLASFLGSFGAVFLKWGAGRLQLDWRTLVYNCELSILFPMVSLGYIWTLLWSRLFFGEPMTRRKCAGLALIFCGLLVLNMGNR